MKIKQKKVEYTFIAVYFKMNIFIKGKQIQLKTEKNIVMELILFIICV